MPNPGAFLGPRGEFLKSQLEIYTQAVKDGDVNDVVAGIQRRYFKRWPITLPHEQEQTEEWLAGVDDDAPDADFQEPDVEGLTPEEAAKALEEYGRLMKELKLRKEAIKRRMHYMYTKEKERSLGSGKSENDPITVLLGKLTGVDLKIPRMKTAYNLWGPNNRAVVDPIFNERVEKGKVPPSKQLALRSAIYKELFEKLPAATQEEWTKKAAREHDKLVREVMTKRKEAISTEPEDRQRVINNVAKIVQPILDLLMDLTGWKGSLVIGGPEPADGGRLNMIWIHAGVAPGSVKMNFGRSERHAFKEAIIPAFASYLKRCFPMDLCRETALPQDHDLPSLAESVSNLNADDGVEVLSLSVDKEHVESSKQHKGRKILEDLYQTSKKSSKYSGPPTGTPSPPVRFTGPPLGKSKKRELPSKDKTKTSTAPIKSSPLAQAPVINATDDEAYDSEHANAGSTSATTKPTPEKEAGTPSAEQIGTASPPAGSTPKDVSAAPGDSQPASSSPSKVTSPPPSRPTSPAPSPPASPPPSRPVSPEPSQLMLPPPSQPGSPHSSPPGPSPPPSRSTPTHLLPTGPAVSLIASRPSGTATVPDFSDIQVPTAPQEKRKRGEEGRAVIAAKRAQASTGPAGSKRKAAGSGSQASKKRRTDSTNPGDDEDANAMAFSVDLPEPCAPWLRNALDLVASEDLGLPWQGLVAAWLRFEGKMGYKEQGGKLPSKARPAVIGDWIKRARAPRCPSNIGDTSTFKKKFNAWWLSLQPSWRVEGSGGSLTRDGADWTALEQYYGINGLLSVVACLFFWGSKPLPPSQRRGWDDAVDDVLYVLEQLSASG